MSLKIEFHLSRCYWVYASLQTTLLLFNPCPADPDIPCICKQCRSRSDGFWICTVCHSVCEFISITWASVAQLDARPTGDQRSQVRPPPRSATFFHEIDHEIFSAVILSLPLIQEGQLSVSGKRMCTILVNRLEN